MRINVFLASTGLGSRRSVEQFIREGRIAINGKTITELASQVDPFVDQVTCDGKSIRSHDLRYVMFYKPRGCACTRMDPHSQKTIYDLLPPELHHLAYAGRLDVDSEGLLFLSNDGSWIQRITHPRHQVIKTYEVEVVGHPAEGTLETARQGIQDRGERLKVSSVRVLVKKTRASLLCITLQEGKKREIRRIFGALHHPVTRLKRIAIGDISLKNLKTGQWRDLTSEELKMLCHS